MKMNRYWLVLAAISIFIFCLTIHAQEISHERELFRSLLLTEEENDFVSIQNVKGQFTNHGWQSMEDGSDGSYLLMTLKDRMPQSATVEWSMKNYNPADQSSAKKQHIFFMTGSEDSDERYYDDGSWVFLRTGTSYINADRSVGMSIDVGSKGEDTRVEDYIIKNKTWDKNLSYRFKLVYDNSFMWIYLNDELLLKAEFPGQIKRFNQIYFAGDPRESSMAGPIYSDFSVSTYNNDMFFIDRTGTKNSSGFIGQGFGGQGVAVGDVNGDGLDDLYVGNCEQGECLRDILYIQQPDGAYRDETLDRGVLNDCCSYGINFFDADNDGDLDIFTANTYKPNRLYINDGYGYFSEEALARGIENINGDTRASVVFDVNNDGHLDIFAANWRIQNEMYINDGTGHFRREFRGAEGAVENPKNMSTQAVTVADIDDDGDYEIYLSKRDAENELYLNENGNFRNVAATRGVAVPDPSGGATFADFDNDGDMDLFVSNNRLQDQQDKIYLGVFINDGTGFFLDHTETYNLLMEGHTTLLTDANNDGHLDLYRLRSNQYHKASVAILSLSDGAGGFSTAGYCGATIIGADARSCASFDFDADGDLDFYVTTHLFENVYLENRSNISNNNWIDISTVGPKGDLGGIGSKIKVYKPGFLNSSSGGLGSRQVVTAQGYLSGPSTIQHFGLGNYTSCDVRVILTDGTVIDRHNVAANQHIVVVGQQKVLEYISGNDQTGIVNQLLAQPFRVRLVNEDGTPVANQAVSFVVTQGDGTFDDNSTIETDASGYASIFYRPGSLEGSHIIEARVPGAKDSPIQFFVTVRAAALTLQKVSGDNQTGPVGTMLPLPLEVQAGYESGGAAANVAVTFTVISGGGSVNDGPSQVVQSDHHGRASASWTLGSMSGQQLLKVSVPGSSVDFYATATAGQPTLLQKVSGDGQTLIPGITFPQPFSVRVSDDNGNPVPEHDVTFKVTSGNGTIDGATDTMISTDQQGMARVAWTPSMYLGPANTLQAQSSFQGRALLNSPIIWTFPGVSVDSSKSSVSATSPVPADGVSTSRIEVTLRDAQEQPLGAGLTVDISATGSENYIQMERDTTDAQGQIVATLSSIVAESKIITAVVKGLELELASHPTVVFEPTNQTPDKILVVSGNEQTVAANENSEPMVVMIVDTESRPVANYDITFVVTEGEGSINGQNLQVVQTGADGMASVIFKASTTSGIKSTIEARAINVTNSPAVFTITSVPGVAQKLSIVSGNNQRGAPNTRLPEPLAVVVKDEYDNLIANFPVQFKVNAGQCTLNGAAQVTAFTNSEGIASVQATLGEQQGQSIVEAKIDSASVMFTLMTEELPDPDLKLSTITATSPVLADGLSTSEIIVTIFDELARPIEGIKVKVTVLGEGTKLVQPDSLTDDQGKLPANLTATVPGEKILLASVLPQNVYIEQKATVVFEREKPTIEIVSGQEQEGTVGQKSPQPLVAKLKNGENPYAGQYVRFTVDSGGGHFNGQDTLMVTTDSLGLASAEYFIGTKAGLNIVRVATLIAPDEGLTFKITGHADQATKLLKQSGDEQLGQVGKELPEKLTVLVADIYDNPVPKSSVTFSAIDGGAIAAPQSVLTDSSGSAGATAILGSNIGPYTFKATLPTGAFVLFSATAENTNSAPDIISHVPAETELEFSYGERLTFEITQVVDQNNDPIYYSWFLNDQIVGNQVKLLLYMSQVFPKENALTCAVSDGQDSSYVHWTLRLRPEAVDLSAFQAEYEKGRGVRLTWSTAAEHNNAGFHILRASEDGDYKRITEDMIKPKSSRDYQFTDIEKLSPGIFHYKLKSISMSGQTSEYGPVSVTVQAPEKMALLQNYPNPFNPTTTLAFELPKDVLVRLVIYNQSGQKIRELVNREMSAGYHEVVWDARDEYGVRVPTGIYLYRMTAGEFSEVRKLTLLK